MTIAELLAKLLEVYPGATPQAVAGFAGAFRSRLGSREGDVLKQTYDDTIASFEPKATKPFPIPVDFEKNLPARALFQKDYGPALDFKGRNERHAGLMATWRRRQRPKIAEARGPIVAGQCEWEFGRIAWRKAWWEGAQDFVLTAEQIAAQEERCVTQERARKFGPIPTDPGTWHDQIAQCRAAILAGKRIDVKNDEDREAA